jgi:hypothetical protein
MRFKCANLQLVENEMWQQQNEASEAKTDASKADGGINSLLKDLKTQQGNATPFDVTFLPTQKDIEAWLVERKKRELADKYL